ncbi:MAG: hypothetical protein ABII71_01560 [Candidatus Micrarchaeota archaeon]
MVEDVIEICARCGKMPRSVDFDIGTGEFRCTRCGNNDLMVVNGSDYERVVAELEDKFTRQAIKTSVPRSGFADESELPDMIHHRPIGTPAARPAPRIVAPKKAARKAAIMKPKKAAKKAPKKRKAAKKAPKRAARKSIRKAAKKKTVGKATKKKTRKR